MTNRIISRGGSKYRIISTTMTESLAMREASRYDAKVIKLNDEEKKREGANYAVVVKAIGLFGA
jgi:hypothetical protein